MTMILWCCFIRLSTCISGYNLDTLMVSVFKREGYNLCLLGTCKVYVWGYLMGFYFAIIIYFNMSFLYVLTFIIGLINMNFSCKVTLEHCEELLEFMKEYTSQGKSGAMLGP